MIAAVVISLLSLSSAVSPEADVGNTTADVISLSSFTSSPSTAAGNNSSLQSSLTRRVPRTPSPSIPKRSLSNLSPETDAGNTTSDVTDLFAGADESNLCLRSGVTCREGRVICVILPKRNLTGELLPPALPSLRRLNLRDNSLHGALPPNLLLHAPSLRSLILAGNSFSGEIPPSLYLCRRLRHLDLSRNSLAGPLPAGLGSSLARLESLNLSSNRLSGPLPVDLVNLTNLKKTAGFSHNLFSGPVPLLPFKLFIDLSFNNLSGPIPQTGSPPTAFAGNPSLCGPPLKTPCPPQPAVLPQAISAHLRRSKGGMAAAVIGGDVVAIVVLGLGFSWCYIKCCEGRRGRAAVEGGGGGGLEGEGMELEELMKGGAYVVGKEGMGIVYRVVLGGGEEVAVRRLGGGGKRRKQFMDEARAIAKLHHPNIVRLRAFFWSPDEKLLVHDFLPNSHLSSALHAEKGSGIYPFIPMRWSARLRIMVGVAKGMTHLHEFSPKKYVHGDLRPVNILLGHNMEPCISDFGLTRLADLAGMTCDPDLDPDPTSFPCNNNNNGWYRAPEVAKNGKLSQKCDVYSYGMIMLEMITGRWPVVRTGTSEIDLVRWIDLCVEEKKPAGDVFDPYLAEDYDKEDEMVAALEIAMVCVRESPERRPGMRHVLEMVTHVHETYGRHRQPDTG